MPDTTQDRLLTPTETAVAIGKSLPTLVIMIRAGQAPPSFKQGGRRFFRASEVDAWIEQRAAAE